MNTQWIAEAARDTLAGAAPFPEIVAKLVRAGVEFYHAGQRQVAAVLKIPQR